MILALVRHKRCFPRRLTKFAIQHCPCGVVPNLPHVHEQLVLVRGCIDCIDCVLTVWLLHQQLHYLHHLRIRLYLLQ